jgi:acyl carrier protein
MSIQATEIVVQTLARHLGVGRHEIALTHDLYRDWGFTPLSLVVVLLELERSVALELPPEELSQVRTVADLVAVFRHWVHESDRQSNASLSRRGRVSRRTLSQRRIRRELHHLRWLEREAPLSPVRAIGASLRRSEGALPRAANR